VVGCGAFVACVVARVVVRVVARVVARVFFGGSTGPGFVSFAPLLRFPDVFTTPPLMTAPPGPSMVSTAIEVLFSPMVGGIPDVTLESCSLGCSVVAISVSNTETTRSLSTFEGRAGGADVKDGTWLIVVGRGADVRDGSWLTTGLGGGVDAINGNWLILELVGGVST
jgi:hypothetical protein